MTEPNEEKEQPIVYSDEDLERYASPPEKDYAFIKKTSGGFEVRQGNNNVLLKSFTGDKAEEDARAMLTKLHKTFNPEKRNRGKTAEKRETGKSSKI